MIGLLILCLALGAGNLWFYWRVWRPLRQLAASAKQLSSGDFTALERCSSGVYEIDAIRAAMNAMVGHVRRAQDQERTYIDALTNGQEAERARIARELHDDTTQSLVAIAQSLDIIRNMVEPEAKIAPLLRTARGQAVDTVNNLRQLIANLRPPILAELGLIPALNVLAESSKNIQISVKTVGAVRRLSESQELVLFRSAQEALWNAQRHGQAKRGAIQVTFGADNTSLSIEDDGIGFKPPVAWDILSTRGHYGLVGIRERVQHLEGTIEIVSRPGAGTRVDIHLPITESLQPEGAIRDPVCSAVIEPHQAYASVTHNGTHYYFCCPVCQGAFQADPELYLPKLS
jgi:signal transduction histidine kinase/YHS domain-containing protein